MQEKIKIKKNKYTTVLSYGSTEFARVVWNKEFKTYDVFVKGVPRGCNADYKSAITVACLCWNNFTIADVPDVDAAVGKRD